MISDDEVPAKIEEVAAKIEEVPVKIENVACGSDVMGAGALEEGIYLQPRV